jgi:hypothetical protein
VALAERLLLSLEAGRRFDLAAPARDVAAPVRRATWLSRMLVRPIGQAGAAAAARLMPDLVARTAQATRIPPPCIRTARDLPPSLPPPRVGGPRVGLTAADSRQD